MQAIGYARISTEDQSQHSLPGQQREITEYCKRNNLTLQKIFTDKGQSAFNFQRREWQQVEAYLKEHREVKYLVIISMDRFSRANLVDSLLKLDEIQKRTGVKILTIADPVDLDTDDFGTDLRRIIELLFSNYELKKIRKRTSDGMYQAMSSGRWVSRAPYGYNNGRDVDGKTILTVDEEKAFLVRMVFRSYLQGHELEEIRKQIRANGMKLKGNSAIRRMLANPLYAGLVQVPKHGKNPAAVIKGIHPPIIAESDYWLVQDKLNNKTRATQRNDNVYLKGAIHCEHCGKVLSSDKVKNSKGNYYLYYLCKDHRQYKSANKLHKQVDAILEVLSLPADVVEETTEILRGLLNEHMGTRGGDMMRAKLNLEKIQQRITATQEKYLLQPDIPKNVYTRAITELKADEVRLQQQLAELQNTKEHYHTIMHELLPMLKDTRALFHSLPQNKKVQFLNILFGAPITYVDGIVRTGQLYFLFADKELILKEKKLLYVEQLSSDFGITPVSRTSGSWFEQLYKLWEVLAA